MLSTCAQAFALELQAFSVLPFQQTTDPVEKLPAQNVAFEELIIPDEIHDLLRWSDWIRAYRATADFFDRKLAGSSPGFAGKYCRTSTAIPGPNNSEKTICQTKSAAGTVCAHRKYRLHALVSWLFECVRL